MDHQIALEDRNDSLRRPVAGRLATALRLGDFILHTISRSAGRGQMTELQSTRRAAWKLAAGAAALPLVHMRTAGAAGNLSVGFWDHWVPAGNAAMRDLVNKWAAQNKVNVAI